MTMRFAQPFQPINSTGPGFNSTLGSSGLYALESTSINRYWQAPTSRSVAIVSKQTDDFYLVFGSSTVSCGTTDGQLFLGGVERVIHVDPTVSYVMFKSSTDMLINFTLGTGF